MIEAGELEAGEDMEDEDEEIDLEIEDDEEMEEDETEELMAEVKKMKKEVEEAKKAKSRAEKELKEALSTISTIKSELNEVNLFNAKLLYTNKIFKAKNLTESQKVKVLTSFDKATSVKEAQLVFETLSEGFKEKKSPINESLLRGSASKPTGVAEKKPILEVNDQFARWQKLAGIKN
jgi:septal ring factor EnvC (AmiA/AmiB activator)